MNIHNNVGVTPKGREATVRDVTDHGVTKAEAARRHHTQKQAGKTSGYRGTAKTHSKQRLICGLREVRCAGRADQTSGSDRILDLWRAGSIR